MPYRSCLAPHGEISTMRLIHQALKSSTLDRLELIERQLCEGVQNQTLPNMGQHALKKVRLELARRKLHAVFESEPNLT